MKRNGRVFIIAGVLLAVAAGGLLFFFLSSMRQEATRVVAPTPVPEIDVVMLSRDVKAGTIITPEMLKASRRKADEVSPEVIRSASEAVDKMLVIETKADAVLKRGDIQPLPFVLPKGKKAMALLVDDLSSVAGLVRERDLVDIVVSGKIELKNPNSDKPLNKGPQGQGGAQPPANDGDSERDAVSVQPEKTQTVVKTVLQRVPVIKVVMAQPRNQNAEQAAAAQQAQAAPTPTGAAAGSNTTPAVSNGRITGAQHIIVLAVTDQEAEVLRFVRETGGFQFVMRGRDDSETEETKGMTLDILIRDYGVPVPRPVLVKLSPE